MRDRLGCQLKLMCSQEQGRCVLCRQGDEDNNHIFLSCQAYNQHREKLLSSIRRSYSRGNNGADILAADDERVIEVLLGTRAGCKRTADEVDRATKRFL